MKRTEVVENREYKIVGGDMDYDVGEIVKIVEHQNQNWFLTDDGIPVHCSCFEPAIEPGDRVKYINEDPVAYFEYGKIFTVDIVSHDGIYDKDGYFACYQNIELTGEYQIGDEVIYGKIKYEIFGIKNTTLALYNPKYNPKFVEMKAVSRLKDPFELEVGDKFLANDGFQYKVLSIDIDKGDGARNGHTLYYSRGLNGEVKGCLAGVWDKDVEEVIYD